MSLSHRITLRQAQGHRNGLAVKTLQEIPIAQIKTIIYF